MLSCIPGTLPNESNLRNDFFRSTSPHFAYWPACCWQLHRHNCPPTREANFKETTTPHIVRKPDHAQENTNASWRTTSTSCFNYFFCGHDIRIMIKPLAQKLPAAALWRNSLMPKGAARKTCLDAGLLRTRGNSSGTKGTEPGNIYDMAVGQR